MKSKGYTLIELLIAVLIFSLISGAAFGVFALAIRVQKYSLASQQLLDQASYAMEYMGRATRMARKNDGTCPTIGDTNYGGNGVKTQLKFRSYSSERGCQEFSLEDGQLKTNDGVIGSLTPLISDDFEVTSLNFNISGDQPGDNSQPKVTIYMEIKGKNMNPLPGIKIQTTVSQRNLDIE